MTGRDAPGPPERLETPDSLSRTSPKPTDARTKRIRTEYAAHVGRMFELMGDTKAVAARNSQIVMKIETSLAKASRKLEDLRDPYANYNKMSVAGLGKLAPSVDWSRMMTDVHATGVDSVIVGQPEFFKAVQANLKSVGVADWKTYLRWHLVHSFAGSLSEPFEKESFAFYGTVMSGVKERRPRWKRVLDAQEGAMGELLG